MKHLRNILVVFGFICAQNTISQINYNYFNGSQSSNTIALNWQTSSELNMDFFTVERGIDSFSFSSIESIQANGNSSSSVNYSFNDSDTFSDACYYYRLKSTHYNGDFEYSEIVEVCYNGAIASIDTPDMAQTLIYPNPISSGILRIECKNTTNVNIKILNQAGQLTRRMEWTPVNNLLDVTDLEKGVYHLVFEFNNGDSATKKLIVQ